LVIKDYTQKIAPIYCHICRVNREAENWQRVINPQTLCYLKEIKLKIEQKTQQWVTIMQSRFTDKNKSQKNIILTHQQDKSLSDTSTLTHHA